MELLLSQDQDSIYLNGIDMDEITILNEDCKENFVTLLTYKFIQENIHNLEYKKNDSSEIYTISDQLEQLKKEIYLFAELACSKNVKPNGRYIEFSDMDQLLKYSSNLINKKRYHLINAKRRGIYISNMSNTDTMLDKWYSEKVLAKKK